MSTKIKIQKANNGLVLFIDHGYKNDPEDSENAKELIVFEERMDTHSPSDTKAENSVLKDLFYQLKDSLGFSASNKHSDRILTIREVPGEDHTSVIDDADYLGEIVYDAERLLRALSSQLDAHKSAKKNFPWKKISYSSLNEKKLARILKILKEDD